MRKNWIQAIGVLAVAGGVAQGDWPAWRGPLHNGIAPGGSPPVEWSETQGVVWKQAIPGKGHATPIVVGDRVYVISAVQTEQPNDPAQVEAALAALQDWQRDSFKPPTHWLRFELRCLDLADGTERWMRVLREAPPYAGTHATGSWASGSPLTDGERLYVFLGSYGLYALDFEGKTLWEKDLGVFRTRANFGEGATPAVGGGILVVNCDHEGDSFIVALDARTGEERWRHARDEATSWSTPYLLPLAGSTQAVVSATGRIRAYDLVSGEERWSCGGMTGNVVPSLVVGDGLLFAMSGFRGAALRAIRLEHATGDITGSDAAIAWRANEKTPYVPSPVLRDGLLYHLNANKAELTCRDAATGALHYHAQPLPGQKDVHASLVLADGRLYVAGLNGAVSVVAAGPAFRVLATNTLDDRFTASPIVLGKRLLLRGHDNLYCIE